MKVIIQLLILFFCNVVLANKVTSDRILKAAESDDYEEISEILKDAVEQVNELDGLTLILLAGLSADSEDVRSFGLYYYQSMIRIGVDVEISPPKNDKGKDKVAAFLVFINKFNPFFQEHVFNDSEELSKLSEVLPVWKPICNDSYSPGWVYEVKPDFIKCNQLLQDKKSKISSYIKDRSELFNHDEYYELMMKLYGPNKADDLTKEEIIDIKSRLYTIEKKLDLNGPMTHEFE